MGAGKHERNYASSLCFSEGEAPLERPGQSSTWVKVFIEEYRREREGVDRDRTKRVADLSACIVKLTAKIRAVVEAIGAGTDTPDLHEAVKTWDQDRAGLRDALAREDKAIVVVLHPEVAELYRSELTTIHEALRDEETRDEAISLLRKLIVEIRLTPVEGVKGEMRVDLCGRLPD